MAESLPWFSGCASKTPLVVQLHIGRRELCADGKQHRRQSKLAGKRTRLLITDNWDSCTPSRQVSRVTSLGTVGSQLTPVAGVQHWHDDNRVQCYSNSRDQSSCGEDRFCCAGTHHPCALLPCQGRLVSCLWHSLNYPCATNEQHGARDKLQRVGKGG